MGAEPAKTWQFSCCGTMLPHTLPPFHMYKEQLSGSDRKLQNKRNTHNTASSHTQVDLRCRASDRLVTVTSLSASTNILIIRVISGTSVTSAPSQLASPGTTVAEVLSTSLDEHSCCQVNSQLAGLSTLPTEKIGE